MSEAVTLTVMTPSEPALATGGADFASQSSPRDSEDRDELSSGEESAAAAALLGLGSAWPSSPDDEGAEDYPEGGSGFAYDAAADLWDATHAAAGHRMLYDSPGEAYSPKTFRGSLDYDTPGNPSPKRMRAPKDGARPFYFARALGPSARAARSLARRPAHLSRASWDLGH